MSKFEHPIRSLFQIGLVLLVSLNGCTVEQTREAVDAGSVKSVVLSYPSIDPELGEKLYPAEQALAQELAVVIENSIRKEYRPGSARRDAHPKAHGCVKAEFKVMDSLPEPFAKGMFVPGKQYQAWIRFSNGSKDANRRDIKGDARGMAIKILGVPGKHIFEHEEHVASQDSIMISHPVFFANDPHRYLSLIKATSSDSFFRKLLIPFELGLKGTLIARNTTSKRIQILCKRGTGPWSPTS